MANRSQPILGDGGEGERSSEPRYNASEEADVALQSVGQDLREARQRKAKTLSDVCVVLKIRPEHLRAIEEGRFEALPGRVYAIGYVRSYAAHLGLHAKTFVDRVKADIDGRIGVKDVPADVLPLAERNIPQRGATIVALLVLVVIYTCYQVFAPPTRIVEPPVMPVPARLLAQAAPKENLAEPTRIPVEQRAPGLSREAILPVPMEIAITPVVVLAAELIPKVHQPLPLGRRYGLQNRNSRITLRAHRPIHVAVQGRRNRTFIDRILATGDTYQVPNTVALRLSVPDAGAIEVILDGRSVGFAGEDGVAAAGLPLSPRLIVDRQPP